MANDTTVTAKNAKSNTSAEPVGEQLFSDYLDPSQLLRVLTAVKKGDFSARMPVDKTGVAGKIADTLNEIVELNERAVKELDRVSTAVGKDGMIAQRASLDNAGGGWQGYAASINSLISDMVQPTSEVARVIGAVAKGDLSQSMALEIEGRPIKGEFLRIAKVVNTMVEQLNSFASEVTRVAREVGTEGKLGGQAHVKGVAGTWKDLTDNVNSMAANLTSQVRNIAEVTTAVAKGDLSKKITVDVKGEILELKNTINTMVDQLNSFASEVTRVAREVGTEGKLGGQAHVKGVAGTWKDLTDNVNFMASNLTSQVRGIATVVTAVANGDLKRKLLLEVKGEIAALADTINGMIDTLAIFADQVTTVAREVGVEGKLGGQAKVPGASGTWRDLTDNVNQLAANLTTQVRAIAEVATAVTKGDLTRSISVQAHGEVAVLKDNLNEMIRNLKDTTQKNTEQDWLKTNVTKFTRMLQGQRDLLTVANMILSELSPVVGSQHGVFYLMEEGEAPGLRLLGSYAHRKRHNVPDWFRLGEGLIGQTAVDKRRLLITDVPNDYIKLASGVGERKPSTIIILPVLFEGQVKAVIELATFDRFSATHLAFLDQLMESIGIVLNTIATNMRTEDLLKQSQELTQSLQRQQGELRDTNEKLEEKARLLSAQKEEIENKNQEVELAKNALEEKAEQLALTSKYKSQFLANMSHELRTPLNSLLILAKMLYENQEGNLTGKQVEFAKTVYQSGSDLLALINEILDMSKIESGMITVEIGELGVAELTDFVERNFRQVAHDRGLEFKIEQGRNMPKSVSTDSKRLLQVIKNLLSNAFKFTEKGSVTLRIEKPAKGTRFENPALETLSLDEIVAYSVVDTGIGIPQDKQRVIFEAFQQADMTTSRKYGGTGLGLTISREIAKRLGGEIQVASTPGQGSSFTLFLPRVFTAPAAKEGDEPVKVVVGGPAKRHHQQADELTWRPEVRDDRDSVKTGELSLLIVEDDAAFAMIMVAVAREQGFKALVAQSGETAIALAQKHKPSAITLDIGLPDMEGWRVLDLLKHDPQTRHIPVEVVSGDDERQRALKVGARGSLRKPVSREDLAAHLIEVKAFINRQTRTLLLVEDDETQRKALAALLDSDDVQTTAVATGEEALKAVAAGHYDCMVLDLGLADMSGFELLEKMKADESLRYVPVIVYTGKELTAKEETKLRKLAKTIIVKDARSLERLLDETSLYLHRQEARLSQEQRQMLLSGQRLDPQLVGKRVLVVDDDVRNIFALTSVLERQKIEVFYAENGKDGIAMLEKTPNVDVVLMDVMMPEMDGYETMRAIRNIPKFKDLPIISLTAKAMKGDREKCLEAGASDYIAKPVEPSQLLSLVRVWAYR
jgi:CheY-like chemotaxis protein/signal transduction histidine kinase/HAMP domain-containing protein